jgi:CBS domain-containing protein
MHASHIMTRNVITVGPDAPILHAVRLMLQHRVSGLPVVDPAGKLIGIVTEGDFLRRPEIDTQRRRPRWVEFLIGPGQMADEYVHTSGRKVHEVMSVNLHTVGEDASVGDIVQMMERHHIKRVPVVRGDRLVGIVTRSSVMRALAAVSHEAKPVADDDAKVRESLLAHLQKQPWAPVALVDVTVRDGVVNLWGSITEESQRRALIVAAENTPGVKAVRDHLVWVEPITGLVVTDDTRAQAS